MGLDVHAMSHLRYAGPIPADEAREQFEKDAAARGVEFVYVRANDAAHKARLTGTKPGVYEVTERTQDHEFRAGSYSGYNEWRRMLCLYAHGVEPQEVWRHKQRYRGKAFVELIDFTDCDGRIGAKVAAKLAQDFRDHAKRVADYSTTIENGDYLWEVYQDFATAFALAAQDGVVRFA